MNCQKCGNGKSYEWAESVKMIGGYNARLCHGCLNAFHEYARELPLWAELARLQDRNNDIQVAAYGKEEPTEALAPVRARLNEIDREWYAISKAWMAMVAVDAAANK